MIIEFKHITEVNPSEITLKRDGTIVLNKDGEKKHVIGNWSVQHPKKEAKEKGWIAKEFVDSIYNGGIPYKGTAFGYSRNEFINSLCTLIANKGIEIKQ